MFLSVVVVVIQYLKHFQLRQLPLLERFALLISVTVIWAYAHLLTASGAYKHHPDLTQKNCRTDKANLISSAPWSENFLHPYLPQNKHHLIINFIRTQGIFLKCVLSVTMCRIKIPYPLQWGAPSFDAGHAFGMMAAVLVSLIEVKRKNLNSQLISLV